MKKIFPIIIMVLVFSGFLTGQIVFDYLSLEADPQTTEITELNAYTKYYREYFLDEKNQKRPKITILTFWASWCAPCLEELQILQKVQKTFGSDRVRILAINGDEIDQKRKIDRVKEELGLDFEMIVDSTGFYFDMYNVSALPFTLLHQEGKAQKVLQTEEILNEKKFFSTLENVFLKI